MPSSRFLRPDSLLRNPEFRTFLLANVFFHFCLPSLTIMLAFHIYSLRSDPLYIAALGFV